MDFEIPLPEELELLEANSRLQEEEDDCLDFHAPEPFPIDGDEEDDVALNDPQVRQPESPPSEDADINGYKRPRPHTPDLPGNSGRFLPSGEKRSKIDNSRRDVEDEDWLRDSPPKEVDSAMEEEEDEILQETVLSRYASEIDGECVPITAPDGGERVYAKICRAEGEERVKKLDVKGKFKGLIRQSISFLLQRAEQEAFNKALQTSSEDQSVAVPAETFAVHEKLWVDKYSPSSFTELLSDEQTNREVLLWLKQWDSSVFGSEIRSTPDEVLSALKRHSTTSQHQRPYGSTFTRKNQGHRWSKGSSRYPKNPDTGNSNLKDMQDLWNRKSKHTGPPEQKILLLCGAPGLGKTTLAHVAANHCGYRVVEINASDERLSSTIEAKILDVVQMNSVTADSRPKCLVIDEIDGALGEGKGAIDVIVKMVSAERKYAMGKENIANGQLGKTSSKRAQQTASLSRPVICICNDLYAPALRPLRQVAKVHIFVQPTASRVVNRLKYICNKEGMKISSFALTALAEYTECDIRACLNTLQFLNKKKETLNATDIGSQVVGHKDTSKSVFDVWKELFHKRKIKRERRCIDTAGSTCNEFDFLHSLVSHRGDYDLIFDGVHENILQLHYHDPVMEKTVSCLDCLGTSDMLHRYIMRTQQMSLYVYCPSLAISIHLAVAQVQKPNIDWPKSYQRCRTLLMEKQEALRSWHHKIPPCIGRHLSIKSFVEESVSPLLYILAPPSLRPVALHLLSNEEKGDLAGLVSTMVSYSITYKNVKPDPASGNLGENAASDASALAFDPPLFDFINFNGHKSSHHVLALAMKQVLVHEIEKQKILRVSGGRHEILEDQETNKGKQDSTGKSNATSSKGQRNPSTSEVPSNPGGNATTSKPKSSGDAKKTSRSAVNFFDRFRKSRKDSQDTNDGQKPETAERDLRPLLFKFNEGFTNAVKRPVRIRDFLL